jgi:hypothetical protein
MIRRYSRPLYFYDGLHDATLSFMHRLDGTPGALWLTVLGIKFVDQDLGWPFLIKAFETKKPSSALN